MTLIKLSILTFYLRVFGSAHPRFRIVCYVLIAYIVMWLVTFYFVFAFTCVPFSRMWSLTDYCPLNVAGQYAAGAIGTLHDILVVIVPQPIIWRLQMPLQRKLAISSIFLIGLV